ncbi:MAG: LodA/GoxA family CTQ-dependent oxidase, partial [Planctomycetota bacterium]
MDVEGAEHRDLALSSRQLAQLKKWADGDFLADYDPKRKIKHDLTEYDLGDQPHILTEAALSFCVA